MRRLSLKWKFMLAVSAMIIAVMAGVGWTFLRRERRMITAALEDKGVLLARSLAVASADKVATNDFSELAHYVDDVRRDPETAYVYIYEDGSRTCVAASDESGSHAAEGKPYDWFKADLVAVSTAPRLAVVEGLEVVDTFAPVVIGTTRYGLVRVGLKLDNLHASLRRTRNTVLAILAVSVLLGIVVSGFLEDLILGPVGALVKGVEAVSVGDFAHRIEVPTGDELGQLAGAFNRMTHNISVLYSVSNAMNFMADTDKLLELILTKALEALEAERGSLMLLDDLGENLQVKVISGLKEPNYRLVKIPKGEGIAGQVAKTGEPLIVNEGSQDPRFKIFAQNQESDRKVRSLLCVPLKMGDAVLGCINAVNKRSGELFSEDDAKLLAVLASQAAVTLNKARLYEESITDGLTKLFIHRYFQIRLEDEVARARRYSAKLSLIMFDIDHFKAFNDRFGHPQGDLVLKHTAQLVKESLRENLDVACRYGGEEFAIIMPETGHDGALAVAERLRRKIEAFDFPGQAEPVKVTISLGVAQFPDDGVDKAVLIRHADTALYHSKEHGRNRTSVYERSMDDD